MSLQPGAESEEPGADRVVAPIKPFFSEDSPMKQPHKRHRSGHAHDATTPEESAHEERMLDDALEQSFPASDPPAPAMPHDTSPGSKDAPVKRPSRSRKASRKH